MNIGQRLKSLREINGLTQEELGKAIGVNKATVNRYETGVIDIKRTIAIKLAEVLKTTPAHLMGWDEDIGKMPLRYLLENNPEWKEKIKKWENAEPVSDEHLLKLIDAYKNNPAMQKAVDTLLGIEQE